MSHKIGITACSNPMHPSFSADLARLCQILRELGFDPVLSPCLYDNGSGFSGTGAERADALMNLYCDPEITDIFDVSGGDMANEVLPYLDFSVIAASGKRFWGYSDLTTIVNAVTTATGNESMLYQVRNLLYDHSAEQITLFQNAFSGQSPSLFDLSCTFLQGDHMEGLFLPSTEAKAQRDDCSLPRGQLVDRVHQELAVDIVLNGLQDKVLVGAENVGEQQLVPVPVGVERLVKADLGLLRRGLAQVHEYLIFNAARGVGRELDVLVAAVRVHCLDEPDRTDGDEVFDVDAGIFKPARDVGDKPQVVLNERAAHALVAFIHARDELSFLLPLERRRERIAAADVENSPPRDEPPVDEIKAQSTPQRFEQALHASPPFRILRTTVPHMHRRRRAGAPPGQRHASRV